MGHFQKPDIKKTSVLDVNHILSDGLLQLCQNDSAVHGLISPRHDEILSLLTKYIDEIEKYNPTLGLTGACNQAELIVRHILDSLAPLTVLLPYLRQYAEKSPLNDRQIQIADVGSGAGLPGIPLAISLSSIQFTLIERMGRRAGFLRNTQATLDLSNLSVEEAEMEKTKPGRFALVTFRALKPLEPKILKQLFRLCTDGGILAAYKGRSEKIKDEMCNLEKLQPELIGRWSSTTCPVPFLSDQRHLVVINKEVVSR
jgi:16S rRNA (guanine527-N7)-methyltransferase